MAEPNQTARPAPAPSRLPTPGTVKPLPRTVLNNEKKSQDQVPEQRDGLTRGR